MEILGSRRACSEFGVRRSLFAGSQFAVRRFSELRIPNSEPRTLLFAGWPNTDFRRSQVLRTPNPEPRIPDSAVRGVAEYRSSPFAGSRFAIRGVFFRISDSAGLPEYRIPNSEPPPSAFRTPPFAGSPVLRTPNTELRTSAFPLPTSDFPNPPTSPPP